MFYLPILLKLCGIFSTTRKQINKKTHGVRDDRSSKNKTPLLKLPERNGETVGKVLTDTISESTHEVINSVLANDFIVITDQLRAYNGLKIEHLYINYCNHVAKKYADGLALNT